MKIAINVCFGGFSLSEQALARYAELADKSGFVAFENIRDDPHLIQTIEELGTKCNTRYSEIRIVEIPDNIEWEIMEYDGTEYIAEKHRKWYAPE
jgi:hypothetical protein